MAVLDPKLDKLLKKHGVDEKVHTYLREKNKTNIGQYAGLADSKADVGDGICAPSGLDKNDRLICQPVKSAWQEAEALVAAELDHIRRGKTSDLDDPVDPEVRVKKTNTFDAYYHIQLPGHLVGCDSLVGRCVREYERRTPNAIDIMKVRSLAHKPSDVGESSVDDEPLNHHRFIYKHRVLMNTLALAVAPEWQEAEWSVLL